MTKFNEIAEKCVKGELFGTFILKNGGRLRSNRLYKSSIKDHFYFNGIPGVYNHGLCNDPFYKKNMLPQYNVIDFIPDFMKKKEIKIEIPEGYEIDKENSTFEKIIFKKKETKYPESWEDCTYRLSIGFKTRFGPSEFIANLMEKTSAYTKLLCLRYEWIHIWSQEHEMESDWKPDWNNSANKACICCYRNILGVESWQDVSLPLSFPTVELADKFLKCFENLLEQAKGLY